MSRPVSLMSERLTPPRATLYPILHSRIGPDQFVSRMARLREDARFKAVQPDQFDTEPSPPVPGQEGVGAPVGEDVDEDDGLEIWFDWAFVDFWKNNYCQYRQLAREHRAEISSRHHSTVNCYRPGCTSGNDL